jgi:hypothetical protein
LAGYQNTLIGLMPRNEITIQAASLLGKPEDKAGSIFNFAFCFLQGFSLFERHDSGKIGLTGHDEIIPPTQKGSAFGCCAGCPSPLGARSGRY